MKTPSAELDADSCWDELLRSPDVDPDRAARTESRLRRLSATIEGEIIPRLMMAFEAPQPLFDEPQESETAEAGTGASVDISEFVHLLITQEAYTASEYVKALMAKGMRLRDIYLNLLAPAARLLGRQWEDDSRNFTEVTVAVSRMHQVLLEFSPVFCARQSEKTRSSGHNALIVPLPGEMHNFGLFMVVEFFRRAGWDVWSGAPKADGEITQLVSSQTFDMVGLSVSAERHLGDLDRRIDRLREESLNPDVRVLVGGQVFRENRDLVDQLGVDGYAEDGAEAVELASQLVSRAQ